MIIELTKKDIIKKGNNFYINKAKSTGGMVIVKADWCGHCKRTMPELYKVSQMTGKMYPIFKIDSDKSAEVVSMLGVSGFPTIFFIEKDGRLSSKYEKDRESQAFLNEICERMRVCF